MAFCYHCGQQIPDNANACPYCGTFVNAQPEQQNNQGYAAPQQQTYQQPGYAAPQQQTYQQPGYAAPQQQNYQQPGYAAPQQAAVQPQIEYITPEMDVQRNKGVAWLGYLGVLIGAPLFLIPMFVKRRSPYTQYHVKQSTTLYAFELAYGITYGIIMGILGAIFPVEYVYINHYPYVSASHGAAYTIIGVLLALAFVFFAVLAVMGIINAATGKKKELLLIGKIPWISTLLEKTVYKNC